MVVQPGDSPVPFAPPVWRTECEHLRCLGKMQGRWLVALVVEKPQRERSQGHAILSTAKMACPSCRPRSRDPFSHIGTAQAPETHYLALTRASLSPVFLTEILGTHDWHLRASCHFSCAQGRGLEWRVGTASVAKAVKPAGGQGVCPLSHSTSHESGYRPAPWAD